MGPSPLPYHPRLDILPHDVGAEQAASAAVGKLDFFVCTLKDINVGDMRLHISAHIDHTKFGYGVMCCSKQMLTLNVAQGDNFACA